ncbi:CDK5 regulatory subunit-associated protein 2-like isoform X2 [Microcaecilia unicolor]|uniref:CDK5 regulatory subunit-associated protein 2-like isoform X2 n=1 Tax=Microcaecilia unicolor TaxID=1415580 RepID=A0A6P7Y428_9AMPH|nr:CDK5 regulatory subunit-associated protein 2-like isoform X2 [Microcaecilia unicolor]
MSESVAANLNDKLHETESVTENLNEKLYMAESTIESLKDISSTNSMLLKGSGIDTQFGNCNNVHCVKELDGQNAKNVLDNPDELKQRIKDMEIQLEKYQNVLFLLQAYSKQVPANDSFNAVLTTLKTSLEDILDTNMKENTDDRVPETSLYSSNATEVKRELSNQQRMQLKSELQKENATSLKLLDHVYILQKKIKIMSPSRHKNDIQKMDKTTDHPQEHYRNESLPLSACPSLSDFETSEKSYIESLEDNLNTLKREHEGVMHLPQNLSQDKQNEKLRESLSQANFLVESIRSEYECIKKENEKLQQQLCERDEEIRCLTQDIHKNCNELKRLYEEKQVHQSLQIEQNLCKKLTEVDRRKKDPVTDAEDKNDQNGYLFDAPDNDDGASQCSSRSTVSMSYAPARLVPGHHMWADKNGSHVLGLIEDYDALRKQISEGQKLVCGIEASIEDIQNIKSQASRIKSGDQGSLSSFSTSVIRVQQILEEANRLLKLLWRVSLPSSTSCFSQDEDLKSEIARLRRKLSECERQLHSTVKHLHSTRQLKEDMEKIIIEQLALTHNVLKKARGNLEIQPVEVQQ